MSLPVVVVHTGYHPYLEFTLRQAHARAGHDGLVFMGDRSNDRFPFLRFVDGAAPAYERAAAEIAAVYRHMSTNAPAFELAVFQRWFRIRALMEQEGLDHVLALDSDVLLFGEPAAIRDVWADGCDLALMTPADQWAYRWESSGHTSYWTRDQLGACCDYILHLYTDPAERARLEEKWAFHRETGTPGGVCDMTAFYLYAEERGREAVRNLGDVREGTTFDFNAGLSLNLVEDEYAVRNGLKDVAVDGGRPVAFNRRIGEPVQFLTLHLQGPSKGHVGRMYQGPGFPGRAALGRRLRAYYHARRLAGRAKYAAWTGGRKALRALRGRP